MAPALRLLLSLPLALGCAVASAGEIQVAVAANFAGPMARLAAAFKAASGHVVKFSTGATGKFYSQILHGAPFEVLLAADDATPRRLVTEGHGVAGTAFTYASGRLVLWSATSGVVDKQGAVLASGRFRHLAIANPKVAPYGAAAYQVLKARGLAEAVAAKVVQGESVAQAYQFVATGNAEIGFVALSQVAVPGKPVTGSFWLVPSHLHTEIRQDAVLLKTGERNEAARAFLAWLKTEPARQLIESLGYARPAN